MIWPKQRQRPKLKQRPRPTQRSDSYRAKTKTKTRSKPNPKKTNTKITQDQGHNKTKTRIKKDQGPGWDQDQNWYNFKIKTKVIQTSKQIPTEKINKNKNKWIFKFEEKKLKNMLQEIRIQKLFQWSTALSNDSFLKVHDLVCGSQLEFWLK